MIAIVNLGPIRGADMLGPHRYEVRINRAPVCRFEHKRSAGLADCLRKAADAVAMKEAEKLLRLIDAGNPPPA
jgi:hypothetical protein